jgi:uncharacterized protein
MICRRLALSLLLCCAMAGAGEAATIGPWQSIRSAVLDEDREYQVHLPDSYGWAKDRRYPVLYLLDGKTHFFHTTGSVGFLAAQGEIPEMIVVGIASTVRIRDFTQTDWPSRWVGGGGAERFKRFLATELVPSIERNYRTDGFRVLSGHSAAGQFALYCLSSEPSLFQAYFALGPSLDWDDNLPQRALEKAFRATDRLPAFLFLARSDDFGRALADYQSMVATLITTSPRGFRWQSRAYPEETHGSLPLVAQIDALRSLYFGYRFHNDMVENGDDYAQRHFERVSGIVGHPIAIPEAVINSLGYAALSRDDVEEAIALFERNVEANPYSANAQDSLADGYAGAGRWRDAAEAADRAVALATELDHPNRSAFVEQARKMRARLEQEPGNPE